MINNEYSYFELGHIEGLSDSRNNRPRTPELLAAEFIPPLAEEASHNFINGYHSGYEEGQQKTRDAMQKDKSDFIRCR